MGVCLHVCFCVLLACSNHGDQKRALDPLELELAMVVSLLVGVGDGNGSWKSRQVLLTTKLLLQACQIKFG